MAGQCSSRSGVALLEAGRGSWASPGQRVRVTGLGGQAPDAALQVGGTESATLWPVAA